MDATGKGPHASMCMRSRKPFVLCYDVKKATLHYLLMMQNLQKLSLQYFIPGREPLFVGHEDLARSCVQDAYAKAFYYPSSLLLLKHHKQ